MFLYELTDLIYSVLITAESFLISINKDRCYNNAIINVLHIA